MARKAKDSKNLQVFRGSLPQPDVFAKNTGYGCTPSSGPQPDLLACRVRPDNALAHSNPASFNDKFVLPQADGFAYSKNQIIEHINTHGVGAQISVLAIPTFAFVTGIGVHIAAEEAGLSFTLKSRNGLLIPAPSVTVKVTSTPATSGDCALTRTRSEGSFSTFGPLGSARFIDILGTYSLPHGGFATEADEIILEVLSMPSSGVVLGDFQIIVSVSYDVIHRAEA